MSELLDQSESGLLKLGYKYNFKLYRCCWMFFY